MNMSKFRPRCGIRLWGVSAARSFVTRPMSRKWRENIKPSNVGPPMLVSSNNLRVALRRATGRYLIAAAMTGALSAAGAQESPKTIALMAFELVDDTGDRANDDVQKLRLAMISRQLHDAFTENRFYTVVGNEPAAALIADLDKRFALHDCNGCDVDIGRALNADRVLTAWVQKVSNLILNINIQIRDVKTGLIVLNKSVDIRGNTDESWSRGIRYMVRSMMEKNQANR
jgi:hypothetical protein